MAIEGSAVHETRQCPRCGALVSVDPGFSPWCDRCNWNVVRGQQPRPTRLIDRFLGAMGRRAGSALARQMADARNPPGRISLALIAAGAISALVNLITLAILLVGLYLILLPGAHVVVVLAGIFLLFVAWVFRPRVESVPAGILARPEAPALYQLADRVADALKLPPVDGIVVNHEFNASFGRYGWRRRRVMVLGLPLLLVLGPQERVALIGHELAHDRSGDSLRTRFIGGAVRTLESWYEVLHPTTLLPTEWGLSGLAALPAHLLMLVLSWLPMGGSYLLAALLFRDMQRAEYRADLLGAGVSGTPAALGTMAKLHFGPTFRNIASGLYVNERKDVFGDFRRAIERTPPREMERIRRLETIEGHSLDSTHPPTVNRLEVLQGHHSPIATVVLSASDSGRIDLELERLGPEVHRDLLAAVHEEMAPGTEIYYESLEIGWYVD